MENNEYMAFLESQLDSEPSLTSLERWEIENTLTEYYSCLALLEEQMNDEELSDDQRESAYQEYAELCGEGNW